jgi:hypothetical protein
MNLRQVEAQLLQVIRGCHSLGIPTAELDEMAALTRAGEPGVALENLCMQMYEYDVRVPAALFTNLQQLAKSMGISDEILGRLRIE